MSVIRNIYWILNKHKLPHTFDLNMKINILIRAAKSKFNKLGVFRKKIGADQDIFDKKLGGKPGDFFIEIMK